MLKRLSVLVFIVLGFGLLPLLAGCQMGGSFLNGRSYFSRLPFGGSAPGGQSEPEIVLDDRSGTE